MICKKPLIHTINPQINNIGITNKTKLKKYIILTSENSHIL